MASRSRSCALPIWSPCASLSAATSAPSKNPRPSTQAALNAKTPKVSSISAMPDFPRTALRSAGEGYGACNSKLLSRTAGEGGPSPKGLVGEGSADFLLGGAAAVREALLLAGDEFEQRGAAVFGLAAGAQDRVADLRRVLDPLAPAAEVA